MKTREPATLDALTYFLDPKDIFHRIKALSDIYRVAEIGDFHAGEVLDDGLEIHCLEYERGTVLAWISHAGYRIELFTYDMDDVNAFIDHSAFILARGHDDSTWSIEKTPSVDTEDIIANFEYLTDIFYMDESRIFTLVSDALVYENLNTPEGFSAETVKMFLNHEES